MTKNPINQSAKEAKARALLDPTEPFVMVLRQTQGRNNTAIFRDADAEESALAYKDEILGAGGVAFLLKPYRVFEAPEKPVATEIKIGDTNE